jgi:diketogulonate reductase-like aldo/keto reductase
MGVPDLKLNNGKTIPQVALGLWKNTDEQECKTAVKVALKSGYRHFDCAQVYRNEQFLGAAIKEADIKRTDVFITTKINVVNFGYERLLNSYDESLQKLQIDYVDLLLLHFPVTGLRGKSWKALEKIYADKRAKSIGVSNYTIRHLEKLLSECQIKPAVNQVELHVFLQQPELVKFCQDNDILIEAYSPLAHGQGNDDLVLKKIAEKHRKTPQQIMLRWLVEQDFVVLPKSVHEERIKENIDIFDFKLDKDDLAKIKDLDKNLRTCWDPTHVP